MNRKRLTKGVALAALIIALCALPSFVTGAYLVHVLITIGINVVLAASLRFIATSGQLSLAHAGMMSVGAYTSALLTVKAGLSFWLAMPLGGLAAMILAALVGIPFVRLRGIYFTMVTLFLSEFIRLIVQEWKRLTGGASGILDIPRPGPFAVPGLFTIDFSSKAHYYYLILFLALVSLLILYALEHSRIGTTLFSVQQSDSLAESLGVDTAGYRILAFGIGCFFAGIVGAFYGHYYTGINPDSFGYLGEYTSSCIWLSGESDGSPAPSSAPSYSRLCLSCPADYGNMRRLSLPPYCSSLSFSCAKGWSACPTASGKSGRRLHYAENRRLDETLRRAGCRR